VYANALYLLLKAVGLKHFSLRSFLIMRTTVDRGMPVSCYFPDCSASLGLVFLAHNQIINKIDVFFRSSTAWPASADTSVNSTSFSELLKQPVDATFCPSFVRKFCKQPASIVSFRQMQTFDQCLQILQ